MGQGWKWRTKTRVKSFFRGGEFRPILKCVSKLTTVHFFDLVKTTLIDKSSLSFISLSSSITISRNILVSNNLLCDMFIY